MPTSKKKPTKEQVMRLLDRAIEQEETLLEKVRMLEDELAECRRKEENPRHELEELALPASKVSFRLDYYRTDEKERFKGLIEHLPTRESRTFEGNRLEEIGDFIALFVGAVEWPVAMPTPASDHKKSQTFPPDVIENPFEEGTKERSPLIRKLLPDIFGTLTPKKTNLKAVEPAPIPERLGTSPFLVLTEGSEKHQRAVRKGQPLLIEFPIQELGAFFGKPCSVRITAESLEKQPFQTFQTLKYCTPNQNQLRVAVNPLPLEQGVYRLIVSLTTCSEPNGAYYRESRLLIVQQAYGEDAPAAFSSDIGFG